MIETIRRAPVGTSVTLEHHFDGDHENRLALELVDNSMVFGLNNLKSMMEIPPDHF